MVIARDTPSHASEHLCLIYGNNPFRTVCVVERTWQGMPYLSSFIANSWLIDLEDISVTVKGHYAIHTF